MILKNLEKNSKGSRDYMGNIPQWISAASAMATVFFAIYTVVNHLVPFSQKFLVEQQLKNLDSKVEQLNLEIGRLQDEKKKITLERNDLDVSIINITRNLAGSEAELYQTMKHVKDLRNEAQKSEDEKVILENEIKSLSLEKGRLTDEVASIESSWYKQALNNLAVNARIRVPSIIFRENHNSGPNSFNFLSLDTSIYSNDIFYTPIPLDCHFDEKYSSTPDIERIATFRTGREAVEALLRDPYWQLMPSNRSASLKSKILAYMDRKENKLIFDEKLCAEQANLPFPIEYFTSGFAPSDTLSIETNFQAKSREMRRIQAAREKFQKSISNMAKWMKIP